MEERLFTVGLSGLSCQGCVDKLSVALQELPNCKTAVVSQHKAEIVGDIDIETIAKVVSNLGYQLKVPKRIHLYLSGLSCGKCISKIETALTQCDDVFSQHVSKTQLTVETTASVEKLISLIQSLGYQASTREGQDERELLPMQAETVITTHSHRDFHQYILEGVSCASCVKSIEDAVKKIAGITDVKVNLAERTATIWGEVSPEVVIAAIKAAGYTATLFDDDNKRREELHLVEIKQYQRFKNNALISLTIAAPLMIYGFFEGSMEVRDSNQLFWGVIGGVTFILLATVGRYYFVNAWQALKHRRATMDTLVALGTGAAWVYSMLVVFMPDIFPIAARHVYFEATAMILGLITLGHAIETRARSRTSASLNRLLDLQPQTAVLVEGERERTISLTEVKLNMTLRLKPGMRVPVDGKVISGESYIDESMLTGEPLAVHKSTGDNLHAGTVNQDGTLLFIAERIGDETMLARIITLVQQAQASKPTIARLADKIASVFVPIVMVIALFSAIIWFVFAPSPKITYMLITSVSVLIIACPCALGLAIPLSVTVAVGKAAELGILVKDASALQIGADIDIVVLDKTGTLTEGKPQLTTIRPLHVTQKHLLHIAAALEKPSSHPLAKAILEKAENLIIPPITNFQNVAGKGVMGILNQKPVALGNAVMMGDLGINLNDYKQIFSEIGKTETPVFIAENNQLIGILGISDPLRKDSAYAVQKLKDLGLQVIMLTGDIEDTAREIGKQVGVTNIIAGVLPDEKAEKIKKLQITGKKVAMIGDGINDAPALAQANVGLAMSQGSDVAIETASFTLMRHSLMGAVDALALSRATLRNMKGNLCGAFLYNIIGIPIAAGILYPWTDTLLNPMIAGGAMALSSITVVSNANRLRFFKSAKSD